MERDSFEEMIKVMQELVEISRRMVDEIKERRRDDWWKRGEEPPDFEFNGELDNV